MYFPRSHDCVLHIQTFPATVCVKIQELILRYWVSDTLMSKYVEQRRERETEKGRRRSSQKLASRIAQQEMLSTLPETNIAPENGWLEYEFPFGMVYFRLLC